MEPQEIGVTAQRMEEPEPLDHRGLFGMRGGLRDVIGVLGDAFLTQAGKAPMYAPQRMREMEADALQGFFNGNEVEQEDALARLARINPEGAMEARTKLEQEKMNALYKQNTMDYRDAMMRDREQQTEIRKLQGYRTLGPLAAGANEKTWPRIRSLMARLAPAYGLDVGEIPEKFDPEYLETIALLGYPDTGRFERTQQLGADTQDKINKRRPPQGRAVRYVQAIDENGQPVWVEAPSAARRGLAPVPTGRGRRGGGSSAGPRNLPDYVEKRADGYYDRRTGRKLNIRPA